MTQEIELEQLGLKTEEGNLNLLIFDKPVFLGISIFSMITSASLYYLGNGSSILARFLFALFGPFLTYIFFISITIYLGFDSLSQQLGIRKILGFLVISGITSTVISLMLNTRGQYTFIFTYARFLPESITVEDLTFVVVVVMAPLIEETMKALPILIIMRGFIQSWGGKESRILNNSSISTLAAVIVAGMFTMLETYNYILGGIDSDFLTNDDGWYYVYQQIIIRSLSPLHYVTVAIVSFSVFFSLSNLRTKTMTRRDLTPVMVGYAAALAIHGFWNYLASTIQPTDPLLFGFYPVNLFTFGMLILTILLAIIFYSSRIVTTECPYCGLTHNPPFDAKSHYTATPIVQIPSISFFLWKLKMKKVFNNENGTRKIAKEGDMAKVFTCNNCSYPIPVYSVKCWKCDFYLDPPYSEVFQFRKGISDNVSIGINLVLSSAYVTLTLTTLIAIVKEGASEGLSQGVLLFALLGFAYIWSSYWSLNPDTKPLGIILSRFLTGAFFIQTVFLFQFIGMLLADTIGVLIVTTFNVIMIALIFTIILGYEPVIDGGTTYV